MKKSQDVTSQPHKKMLIDQESTLFVMENSELSFRNETICSHYSTFLNYQVPDTRVNVCTFFIEMFFMTRGLHFQPFMLELQLIIQENDGFEN